MDLDRPPFHISDRALQEVRRIVEAKKVPEGYGLRVGMRGGGCGAMGFLLGFDKPKTNDLRYDFDGVDVYMEKPHLLYLLDVTVDFEERRDERGFVFIKASEQAAN